MLIYIYKINLQLVVFETFRNDAVLWKNVVLTDLS